MGRDEQVEEREVLNSIFPEEITDISDTSFRISIELETTPRDEKEGLPPPVLLTVTYPDAYPDEAPQLDISAAPNAPKYVHLDIQEDKARLISALKSTIEESMGMAMVFTLVSTLKDSAELLITERQAAQQAIQDEAAMKAEEEENRKFHGTSVTRETFMVWREKFRKEMELEEERRREEKDVDDKKKRIKVEERLTGKQLFERGMIGKIEEDEDDVVDGEDVSNGLQDLKVEG